MRTRRLPSLFLAAAVVAALSSVGVAPASGGGGIIINFAGLPGEHGFEEPPLLDLDVTNVDAFTDGPPSVSNPIVNVGGLVLDPLALGREPAVFGPAIGLDVRVLSEDENFLEDIGVDYRGLGAPPAEVGNALLVAQLNALIDSLDEDTLRGIGAYALSGEGEVPTAASLDRLAPDFPFAQTLDGFGGDDPAIDAEVDALLDDINQDLADVGLDGLLDTGREPGFLANDLLGPNAPPDQPIHTLREGGVLVLTELQDPFGSAGGNALSEVFINFQLDDELPIDGIVAPGGPPFANSSFANDAFNGSNTEAILREPVGGDPMLETQLLQPGGFFGPTSPVVPMAAIDEVVIAIVPLPLHEGSSGMRIGSFASVDGTFGPGLVGTSTDVPISDTLPAREFEPVRFTPPPRTLATPEIGRALRDWVESLGPADPPADPAGAPDPADDPVDQPVEEPVATTAPSTDDGFPWEPVAIGVGVVAIAGGYVLTRRRDDGEETPPIASTPDSDDPARHVCDWELHWLNGSTWDKLRAVPPGHHACCIYKVQIETTTSMHFLTASFRQDVRPERLFPDPDFSWKGLDFHGHAATRSGPAGRQDWQQGHGDTVDQSMLAPDEGFWQSSQGEERPEVAARIIHREKTTISLTLEPGCVDPESEYNANGKGVLDFLSTQECTNDDPAPGCPVELNAFGRALAEIRGDLNWRLTHQTGTDIDELERADSLRPLWDSHDHEMLDRATRPEQFTGVDNTVSIAFTWDAEIVNEVAFDAAQLVPEHVWPTTERVSAWAGSDASYDIGVQAKMDKGDCEGQGCCGHDPGDHTCNCRPAFSLSLEGENSRITVDGVDTMIGRDRAADRRRPPEWFRGGLTANPGPGVTRNWKTAP